MAEFTKKTQSDGKVQYRNATENKIVGKDTLDELLLAKLDAAPEGTKVPENADLDDSNAEAPAVPAGEKTRKITLRVPLMINGKVFPGGKEIEVSETQYDDLDRMQHEYGEYEANLIRQRTFDKNGEPRPQDVQSNEIR